MAAAMSLNLLLGFTGQISIGHSAFFGIGAYTTAIGVTRYHYSPFLTMPIAFVIAFILGMIVSLPALRIKGIYLALVTLALGLVFPQFIKWPKVSSFTGGAKGLDKTGFRFTKDNPTYEIFGWNPWGNLRGQNVKPFYFWVGLVIVAGRRLRHGRADQLVGGKGGILPPGVVVHHGWTPLNVIRRVKR